MQNGTAYHNIDHPRQHAVIEGWLTGLSTLLKDEPHWPLPLQRTGVRHEWTRSTRTPQTTERISEAPAQRHHRAQRVVRRMRSTSTKWPRAVGETISTVAGG